MLYKNLKCSGTNLLVSLVFVTTQVTEYKMGMLSSDKNHFQNWNQKTYICNMYIKIYLLANINQYFDSLFYKLYERNVTLSCLLLINYFNNYNIK